MDRNFIVLFVAVNILIIGLGGFMVYSDLNLREYSSRYQFDMKVIKVEYLPLVYRPTYDYYYGNNPQDVEHIISKDGWSLDFFQLSIIIMIITDLAWISFERQKRKVAETEGYFN